MAWTDLSPYTVGRFTAAMAELLRGNFKAIGDPWTAYTPTWTGAGFTIGNGTITGARILAGKLCIGEIIATIGSTTTVGTGFYAFGLPASANNINMPIGNCVVFDSSASGVRHRNVYANPATSCAAADESGALVSGITPFNPLAVNDTIKIFFCYQTV